MAEKSNCLLSNCFQYLIVFFFVNVKMKELVIGATFEFELYEPKIDRAGKSSMKRAVVDGHSDNLRLIYKKNSFDDFLTECNQERQLCFQ